MKHIPAVFLAWIPCHAVAQETPSFDCGKAEGTVENLICASPELSALDRTLADTYAHALAAVRALDVGGAEEEATLKAMQRGWIKGRNDCWKADDPRACTEDAYRSRDAELVAQWMLLDPFTEAAWSCGGNRANEVFVMYFDTDLPSIRVEYGDGIAVMTRSPSASGARYDGEFGKMFWEKAGEARFVWQDGEEQQCRLIAG